MPQVRAFGVIATSIWIQVSNIPRKLRKTTVANLREIPGNVTVTVSRNGDIHAFFHKMGNDVWASTSRSFFDVLSQWYDYDFYCASSFWSRDTVAVYLESPVSLEQYNIVSHAIQQLDSVSSIVWSDTADSLFIELTGELTPLVQNQISSILSG